VETPVFLASRRWERILGLRWMYVAGALISSVIALLIALSTEAWMVALFRTLDGTAYALRYIGMVLIIGALLPARLQAFGQSIGWLVAAGIAPIIADVAGGWIYDAIGGSAVFVASAAIGAVGAVVVFLALTGAGLGRRVPAGSHERSEGGAARVVVDR
jgi:PPP family 3-phenylpropionic acid transporter